jgi:hypothetical protein
VSHELLVPIVREALRAIVSDTESCRLLGTALHWADVERIRLAKETQMKIAERSKNQTKTCLTCFEYNAGCEHPKSDRSGCDKWVEGM